MLVIEQTVEQCLIGTRCVCTNRTLVKGRWLSNAKLTSIIEPHTNHLNDPHHSEHTMIQNFLIQNLILNISESVRTVLNTLCLDSKTLECSKV